MKLVLMKFKVASELSNRALVISLAIGSAMLTLVGPGVVSPNAMAAQVIVVRDQDANQIESNAIPPKEDQEPKLQVEENVLVERIDIQRKVPERTGRVVSISQNIQAIQLPCFPLLWGNEIDLGTLLLVAHEHRSAEDEPQRRLTAQWLRPTSEAFRTWYQRLAIDELEDTHDQELQRWRAHLRHPRRVPPVTADVDVNAFVQSEPSGERVTFSVYPSGQLLFSSPESTGLATEGSERFHMRHRISHAGDESSFFQRPQVIRRGVFAFRERQEGMERVFIEHLDGSAAILVTDDESSPVSNRVLYQVELMQPDMSTEKQSDESDYWIGIESVPSDEVNLKVEAEERSLFVKSVVPDSPARRAGIEPGDLLVKFAAEPVSEVEQLVQLIQEHQETPVVVTIIRNRATLQRTIVAERRTSDFDEERVYTLGSVVGREFDPRTVQTAIERWMVHAQSEDNNIVTHKRLQSPRGRLRMVFARPGVILANDEMEFGREIQLDDHRHLRIKAGDGDHLKLELKDQEGIAIFNHNELDDAPEGIRNVLHDVSRRFLWMGGPFEVGGQPLEFYPPGPLTLSWSPRIENSLLTSASPLQIVVESDVEPVSSNVSTFKLRAIDVVERRDDAPQQVEVTLEVDSDEAEALRRRRIELKESMKSLEQEIKLLEREIEALQKIEQDGGQVEIEYRGDRPRDR